MISKNLQFLIKVCHEDTTGLMEIAIMNCIENVTNYVEANEAEVLTNMANGMVDAETFVKANKNLGKAYKDHCANTSKDSYFQKPLVSGKVQEIMDEEQDVYFVRPEIDGGDNGQYKITEYDKKYDVVTVEDRDGDVIEDVEVSNLSLTSPISV